MKVKWKKLSDNNRNLAVRLFLQMTAALVALPISGIILYQLADFIFVSLPWQGTEPLYSLALAVNARRDILLLLYIMAGVIIIIFHFWKKPFAYLDELTEAVSSSYEPGTEEISGLSAPLRDMESKINSMKRTMERNALAAREAEQRKNDLVVYLAHDLKTPLTSVIGYLTLLRDEKEISPELREKYLSISLDKAERLEDLINEFFEITRFNLSHLTLELSRVNLTRMLEQLVFEFKPMLEEKELQCRLRAPADLMCRLDADKMQRVFDNLLRNAVNYSFRGTVIEIEVERERDEVTVVFTNSGSTIPAESLERIFEQFFRLDAARSSRGGGAGLGLAIAREIVQLHGGDITAVSRDEMTSFLLTIPAEGKKGTEAP